MNGNSFVDFFLKIRNSRFFNTLVISVILASALYAGVSSYDIPSNYVYLLEVFDYAITIFFTIEILIRMIAEKSLVKFFKDGWNVFDFPLDVDRIEDYMLLASSLHLAEAFSLMKTTFLKMFSICRITF